VKKIAIVLLFLSTINIYGISVEDYIIRNEETQRNYRQKVFLGQVWEDNWLDDLLINKEEYVTWSGYKDVIKYNFENIEILVARRTPRALSREIVQMKMKGEKFSTYRGITIGATQNEVMQIYGEATDVIFAEGKTYLSYDLNDPYSDFGNNVREYCLLFGFIDNTVVSITVHYIHNI
jgi:hypothetical protein